jgi:hypothetical protein
MVDVVGALDEFVLIKNRKAAQQTESDADSVILRPTRKCLLGVGGYF